MRHNLAGRTGIGAVGLRQAGLVGAHGPSSILVIKSHRNQARVGWESASPALFHGIFRACNVKVVVSLCMSKVFQVMAVAMLRSAWRREQEGSSANSGVQLQELHFVWKREFFWRWTEGRGGIPHAQDRPAAEESSSRSPCRQIEHCQV